MKTVLNAAISSASPQEAKTPETLKLQLLSRPAATLQEAVRSPETFAGALTGHLAGMDEEGRILFQEDGAQAPYLVVIGLPLTDEVVVAAVQAQRRALVIRPDNQPSQPVLVALLREGISTEARDKVGSERTRIDGQAVAIDAQQSLELNCGRARITMHADGRIELNGDYLLSRSRGPIKLKGATIDIN